MATRNQVLSLFGATPAQIQERQRQEQAEMILSQRDPYAKTGAALGIALANIFGGETEELTRAKGVESIVKGAQTEQVKERTAEKQTAAELEEFKAKLRAAGGQATKTPEQTPEDTIRKQLQDAYEINTTLADRLAAAGYTEEAQLAQQSALDAGLGLMSLETTLADLAKTRAETAAELAPQKESYGNYVDPNTNQPFFGYRVGGTVYNADTDKAVPQALKYQEGVIAGPGSTAIGARASDVAGTLITDDQYKGLSAEERQAVSSQIAAEAERRIQSTPKGQRTQNQADLYKEIWQEIKNAGGVRETEWWEFWKDDTELVTPEASGGVPRITTQAQYNALPSGATYIGPNGQTARKP